MGGETASTAPLANRSYTSSTQMAFIMIPERHVLYFYTGDGLRHQSSCRKLSCQLSYFLIIDFRQIRVTRDQQRFIPHDRFGDLAKCLHKKGDAFQLFLTHFFISLPFPSKGISLASNHFESSPQ